jgi:hypothetical protein
MRSEQIAEFAPNVYIFFKNKFEKSVRALTGLSSFLLGHKGNFQY